MFAHFQAVLKSRTLNLKSVMCTFREFMKKCGLLFIPTSDHTVHRRFIRCNLCRLGLKYFGMGHVRLVVISRE